MSELKASEQLSSVVLTVGCMLETHGKFKKPNQTKPKVFEVATRLLKSEFWDGRQRSIFSESPPMRFQRTGRVESRCLS